MGDVLCQFATHLFLLFLLLASDALIHPVGKSVKYPPQPYQHQNGESKEA